MRLCQFLSAIFCSIVVFSCTTNADADELYASIFMDECSFAELNGIEEECAKKKLKKNTNLLPEPGKLKRICAGENEGFNFVVAYDGAPDMEIRITGEDVLGLQWHPARNKSHWGRLRIPSSGGVSVIGRRTTLLPLPAHLSKSFSLLGIHCYVVEAYKKNVSAQKSGIRLAKTKLGRIEVEAGFDDSFDDAIIHIEKFQLEELDIDLRMNNSSIELCHQSNEVFYFLSSTPRSGGINQTPTPYNLFPSEPRHLLFEIAGGYTDFQSTYWYRSEVSNSSSNYLSGTFSQVTSFSGCSILSYAEDNPSAGCTITSNNSFECKYGTGTYPITKTTVRRYSYNYRPFDFRDPYPCPGSAAGICK